MDDRHADAADPLPQMPSCCSEPAEKEPAAPKPPPVSCCCPSAGAAGLPTQRAAAKQNAPRAWIAGTVESPVGPVPRVRTALLPADRVGTWKARWDIGRMRFAVAPGLYAVGAPTADSPVFVSANYKMSFDRLRSNLSGVDGWVLVLDTRGINVWCAAGKGTFGTDELVQRVAAARLDEVVSHRRLIVPQLGAPGVAAHEVKQRSGFRVTYGPVRAEDLRAFMAAGNKATSEMRRVRFPLADRLAVAPVELVMAARPVLLVAAALFVLGGLGRDGFTVARLIGTGLTGALLFVAVGVAAVVSIPALLPWLPGRALSTKGFWFGAATAVPIVAGGYSSGFPIGGDAPTLAAWALIVPCLGSFLAMNFTGATTYTSLSGVTREMRRAVPIQIAAAVAAAALWLIGRFA